MKKTFKNFIKYDANTAKLAKAVRKQLGTETDDEFFETMENVTACSCGAASGFTGFIYYSETVEFFRKNKTVIRNNIQELAIDLGETVISMVLGFNSVKGSFTEDEVGKALYGNYDSDLDGLYNNFAWYALEEVAYRASNFAYECDDE